MIECDDPAFEYYAPPKTGCVSTWTALRKRFEIRVVGGDPHARVPLPDKRDHFHFLTVRNPFPRAVSWWWHYRTKILKPWPSPSRRRAYEMARRMTFREFCLDKETQAQFRPCALWRDGMLRCDAVIRNEQLEDDLRKLPFAHDLSVPRLNVGRDGYGDWRAHYDAASLEVVRQRLGPDFAAFDYSDTI